MKKLAALIVTLLLIPFFCLSYVFAEDTSSQLRDLEAKIAEYEQKIEEARSKQKTLATTISVLDNQIYLTGAKISQAQEKIRILQIEIEDLSQKIDILETSLEETTNILKARIEATYKRSFMPSVYLLLGSENFSDFFSSVKYIQSAQKHDKEVMYAMEETKANFDQQKNLKQDKQTELKDQEIFLNNQKVVLGQQKAAKQDLLITTKNDEQKFQQLLAQARAEFEAIQAIIAGKGDEEEGGEVKAGDTIASVISGSSCNSSGTHLHFTVADNSGNALNPFGFLKGIDYENCSGPGECSEGDPFNPSGGWDWPISPKISFFQGFGNTWAVRNTWVGQIYNFHNGIDIRSSSNTIRAVADGKLFRGSYSGSGGCKLRYVRVEHKEGDKQTFYLHVNY